MQLSVIILNYNVRYFLEQCVLSVQEALKGIEAEVIVVDNNSPDDSCVMMRTRFPHITLIENKENTGFPKGNNIGVAVAKGKYICILNPDTVVSNDTFTKLLALAPHKSDMGIATVKLVDGRGRFLPESKMGIPTPWVAATKILGLYKIFPKWRLVNRYYAMHLQPHEAGKVGIVVGAFMFMERSLYNSVGGFDEEFFMYIEDFDLSYTILKTGCSNYYLPVTSVIHYKGESTVKDGTYMVRFKQGMQRFYQKHFRRSPLFDLMMDAGTLFFSKTKKITDGAVEKPHHYILFSANAGLKTLVSQQFNHDVKQYETYADATLASIPDAESAHTEIIFDNELLTFGDIIAAMERFTHKGFTFKIKPAGSDFMLGSNSSNDRGEVILLQKSTAEAVL
ncbi:glycosyl transferase family 2 [Flavobacterium akiainvivens]|uniref:Glycosyl transferase family 2 n=1 Tax=Flavobacterium akiainvivens TaxID=1202724 RepID=A0A0M8MAI2_9FLAO|nr:glycosyltransferase family 2 protein [Flavobacterium akiainvivens]KOS04634.1 glycosyl transferase family 2 [Flavobacterium akiainvivens]SFQ65643.1 Glycosyltransferase, GT2 family [Flavobacterium akiainvivens]